MNLEPLNNKKDIKIFNILFSIYTGYFLSFFITSSIYILINYKIIDFRYEYPVHPMPWFSILIVAVIFSFLLYRSTDYFTAKHSVKLNRTLCSMIMSALLLLFYMNLTLTIISNLQLFYKNIYRWGIYFSLPTLAYICIFFNKYLAYIFTILAISPLAISLLATFIHL